ncbi:hypothetical protein G7059_05860 [Erysipelothrix sp. HDW6A]|uniref:hypothetical protein n=1 Tax=Erysipelothrix sp. HDW6A TaxID=2714928 RepID=UPI0014086A10|nr:hypothetical protein [Erysipelothrix sp. HDW6A]QIK57395.1 hypothetical protein G7059_05860 [Erysipelothrix sp. HDW6A]
MKYTEEQLLGYGVIKDRRRRYLLVIPGTNEGYNIQERNMKYVAIESTKIIWITLSFVVGLGIFKLPIWLCSILTALTFVGFIIFKKYFMLRDVKKIKVIDEDLAKFSSVEGLKIKRSDEFMNTLFPLLVMSMLVARSSDIGGYTGIDIQLYYFYLAVAAVAVIYFAYRSIKITMKIRKLQGK